MARTVLQTTHPRPTPSQRGGWSRGQRVIGAWTAASEHTAALLLVGLDGWWCVAFFPFFEPTSCSFGIRLAAAVGGHGGWRELRCEYSLACSSSARPHSDCRWQVFHSLGTFFSLHLFGVMWRHDYVLLFNGFIGKLKISPYRSASLTRLFSLMLAPLSMNLVFTYNSQRLSGRSCQSDFIDFFSDSSRVPLHWWK